MIRPLASLVLLALVLTSLATSGDAQSTQADVYEVKVTSGPGRAFQPQEVTISEGTVVRWVKVGDDSHTITSTDSNADGQREPNGKFRGVLQEQAHYEHKFDRAGTFPYYCEPHNSLGMIGRITVTGDDDASTPLPIGLALAALGVALVAYRRR